MTTIKNFLDTLPTYAELFERMNFLKTVTSDLVTVKETVDYVWAKVENGAGDEGVLILFPSTKEAVVFGFDHESWLNFYSQKDYKDKQKVFVGFPENLLKPIIEDDDLKWSFDKTFVYATVGFWMKDEQWFVSNIFTKQLENNASNWETEKFSAEYVLKLVLSKENL